jgi:hypothetical protein
MEKNNEFLKAGLRLDENLPRSAEANSAGPPVNAQLQLKPSPRARKDKNRVHATRHAVLSRYPLEALARRGENIRQLRRIELLLRRELKPTGIVAEMFFDRAWSSYLRCLLIARTEAEALTPAEQQTGILNPIPHLQEGELPTLIWREQGTTFENFPADLMKHLSIVQRYDRHFYGEFYRSMGMLVALKNGGEAGLTRQLSKTFGPNKGACEDVDE